MSAPSRRVFDAAAERTLSDAPLLALLAEGQDYMRRLVAPHRAQPDWGVALDEIGRVRRETLAHLERYVAEFAEKVERAGGRVFFAADAAEACEHVVGLARERGVRRIVKSKSMVTEEIGLNPALEAAGAEVVETDLGEYIVQLSGERPFHILGPAIHKSLADIRALFSTAAGYDVGADPPALARYARDVLRGKFFAADMGITGANFGVAATGSIVLVTNEGNGRMTSTLPRTHVVVMGMERLVPSVSDLEAILKILPVVGAGERMTAYVTSITGPRRAGEADGPDELHVVIVDNGRSRILAGRYAQILSCIRCGACLDVCPAYRKIGGHAYDAVYSGPIGAVLSPLLDGLERHPELPFACSLCGACTEVCSARIPLAEMIRELREDAVGCGLVAPAWRAGLAAYAEATKRPRLWGTLETLALPLLRVVPFDGPSLRGRGPLGPWTRERDLPRAGGRSFRASRLMQRGRMSSSNGAWRSGATQAVPQGQTQRPLARHEQPAPSPKGPVDTFVSRLGELGVDIRLVSSLDDARADVESLALERCWKRICCSPALSWSGIANNWTDEAENADFGLSQADWAIAETGSVVVTSGPAVRRGYSLLPKAVGFVIAERSLVSTVGEALTALASTWQMPPSCVTFISGPSNSADIASVHVVGVHGPSELYVWLVREG